MEQTLLCSLKVQIMKCQRTFFISQASLAPACYFWDHQLDNFHHPYWIPFFIVEYRVCTKLPMFCNHQYPNFHTPTYCTAHQNHHAYLNSKTVGAFTFIPQISSNSRQYRKTGRNLLRYTYEYWCFHKLKFLVFVPGKTLATRQSFCHRWASVQFSPFFARWMQFWSRVCSDLPRTWGLFRPAPCSSKRGVDFPPQAGSRGCCHMLALGSQSRYLKCTQRRYRLFCDPICGRMALSVRTGRTCHKYCRFLSFYKL